MALKVRKKSMLRDLLNDSRTTGVLLFGCTIFSLIVCNSSDSHWFFSFWNTLLNTGSHIHALPATPVEWVNKFGMSFFFVLAASEIKRELLDGQLSSFKKAILPCGAALGGMLVPALIFAILNFHASGIRGWGIPTATDIAFSLALASLLGKRFPARLRILLLAIAILDDFGAIVVIVLFYGNFIHWFFLLLGGLTYLGLLACNYFKLKFGAVQIIIGVCMWYIILQSGIEASITGVLFALAMPFKDLAMIEKKIHRFVNFLILPLFALANTAIIIPANALSAITTPLGMGILIGLVIGKPLGIFLGSRVLVGLRIAHLPAHTKWNHILGLGFLGGIGFTMSIFITMLAFSENSLRNISKISILVSLLVSVVISYLYFFLINLKATGITTPSAVTKPDLQTGPS